MRRHAPRWAHALAAVALAASCLAGTGVPGAALPRGAAPVTPPGDAVSVAATPITNPVLWEDLADIDIFRVDNTFYYSASTMHYSPGAPILRSYDLVNWEFAGHSVPRLDFGAKYDFNGGRGYVRGIWASFLNFRRSNNTFYWGGCVDFAQTHIYTATSVEGPWQKRSTIPNCYYDAGLLIDDNDTMYVAYGNTTISVAQLSADGLSQVRTQQVFQTPSSIGTLEGARFYKRNGAYYIFLTRPANGQYILKSTSGPFGPYTVRQLLLDLPGPIPGGGVPHQGGLVQTQNGDWYYLAFVDAFPGGRVPVLAPITWTADGWPILQTVNGAWGTSYPAPNLPPPPRTVKPPTGTDTFTGTALGPEWEWNHNPDNTRWSVGSGLRLQTATVTNDLYSARNTLSHRILGPMSTATIPLDYGSMRDGDRAGLALLRDSSAWIGVKRDGGTNRVVMVNGLTMDSNWNTTGFGTEQAGATISGGRIWLRVNADIRPGTGRQGRFSYSTDGVNFTPLGPGFVMGNDWRFFMGYRYAIFNYATQALGGAVTVPQFTLAGPNPAPPSRVVSLRAQANGRYVTAENAGASPLIANRTTIGLWEQFDLINNANGSVSFRARANNNYVCADNAGASALIANRTAIGPWEEFDLINNANGSVSLRARANNNIVTADANPLIANRTTIGASEQFDLVG
ncbi:MAG TPA: family 43 glycosylhydrolase [Actinophytocola sp.]|uniref:family 43 glycosylhydrolase n=1 Tax=Actinophytocola sp. TaxID=1872138 RepID=UPI002DB5813B|nr:family 43 glycosylhydrolase [Actinophytocola sp.]HEU5474728.1 family 43 glycosylhydrolase [Actinophytocola sp.]